MCTNHTPASLVQTLQLYRRYTAASPLPQKVKLPMLTHKSLFLLLLLALVLSGCIAAPEAAPVPASDAPDAAPSTLETLAFEGNGNTFLAAIEDAAGAADLHQFVEITDGAGNVWQGELLGAGEEGQLFLQAAQQGGADAVRIDGPVDLDLSAVTALLPDAAGESLTSTHPEIRFVRARQSGDAWNFDVTLAYPDTGWEDYADGWHVALPEGDILGTRVLLHPHVNEQPFTRSLSGVQIPADVAEVIIRSHDLISGYSPDVVRVPLSESMVTEQVEVVRE